MLKVITERRSWERFLLGRMNACPDIVGVVGGAESRLAGQEFLSLVVCFRALPFELIEGVSSSALLSTRDGLRGKKDRCGPAERGTGEGDEDCTAAGVTTATRESDRAADG